MDVMGAEGMLGNTNGLPAARVQSSNDEWLINAVGQATSETYASGEGRVTDVFSL